MRLSRRALVAGGIAAGALAACRADDGPAPIVGRRAPDFQVEALGEPGTIGPATFAGRPLVVNFFATWCGPCRAELPAFQSLADRHRDRGLTFLLVDLQEDPDDVAVFLHELKVDLPTGVDRSGEATKLYRVRGLPSTFFVDRAGVIQVAQLGALDERLLENGISKII